MARTKRRREPTPEPIIDPDLIFSPNLTDVSSSLASHLISAQAKGGNLVFSPLSLHVVLGLIAAGSGGPTRDQLLAYFRFESSEELNTLLSRQATILLSDGGPLGGPRLSAAHGMWVDRSLTLKPDFKGIVENDFKAACDRVDFKTKADEVRKEEVNPWVTEKTNGLIKDILPPDSVDSSTRLVFANAIYFKGIWNNKFRTARTKNNRFFLMDGGSVKVPFMTSGNTSQFISVYNDFKVLTLHYKQGEDKRKFAMHIFLPDAKDGLPALVEKFGSEVDFIKNHLPYETEEVRKFLVPKFKIDFELEASELLKSRGLDLMFMGGLTKMVDSELHVSKIYHKSFIEVNEQGTEAAAASVAVCKMQLAGPRRNEEELDFVADHPFMFVVREDVSGVLVFIGQVTNPAS